LMQRYLTGRHQNLLTGTINAYDSVFSRQEEVINGGPRGLILGSIFLLIYINGVPKIIDNDAKVVHFADGTIVIVTTCNQEGVNKERTK